MKYINKLNGKTATIISDMAAGMCNLTMGYTLIVFKYEEDDYEYPFVMESRQFNKEHLEI